MQKRKKHKKYKTLGRQLLVQKSKNRVKTQKTKKYKNVKTVLKTKLSITRSIFEPVARNFSRS